jgi:hypothetical protein
MGNRAEGGGATSQSCDPPLSVSVTTYSPYQCNTSPHCREAIMATVKHHASTILGAFEQARTELIGKAVILTDGKAGTVENVWLDEFHGLRISIKCHEGRWPVSTIKFAQS